MMHYDCIIIFFRWVQNGLSVLFYCIIVDVNSWCTVCFLFTFLLYSILFYVLPSVTLHAEMVWPCEHVCFWLHASNVTCGDTTFMSVCNKSSSRTVIHNKVTTLLVKTWWKKENNTISTFLDSSLWKRDQIICYNCWFHSIAVNVTAVLSNILPIQ